MNLKLPLETQKLIEERVRSGQYESPADVIAAAISQLDQLEQTIKLDAREWDQLLTEGEASGAPLDSNAVLSEIRSLNLRKRFR